MFIKRDYRPDEASHAIPVLTPKRRRLTAAAERLIYYFSLAYRDATPSFSNNGRIGVGMQAGALQMRLKELILATGAIPTGTINVPRSPFGAPGFKIDLDTLFQRGAERRDAIRRSNAARQQSTG
jgi:hypothetical protein